MIRGLVAAVTLLGTGGCLFVGAEPAAVTADRACTLSRTDPVPQVVWVVPSEAELARWERTSDRSADLAARAAVSDPRWSDLADAYSAYADATATMASLWRRLGAVDVDVTMDAAAQMAQRKLFAGVSDADAAQAAADLASSGRLVRSGCRRAAAAAGR